MFLSRILLPSLQSSKANHSTSHFRTTRGFHTSAFLLNQYETVLVEKKDKVGIITLNRPKQLNSLNVQLQNDILAALESYDKDKDVGAIIITGNQKVFAAGADIKMMAPLTYTKVIKEDLFAEWDKIKRIRKPIIAAVNGFALGGGCGLAMFCDIIIAGEKAIFGQPEINLGTIPGMGGTQRLTRAVGKYKAMEWILSGNQFDAHTAERAGLVSRVVPDDQVLPEAVKLATKIASMSQVAVAQAKMSINGSFETTLEQGTALERRAFHTTFATVDRKEGMDAFVSKRTPQWKDE